MNCDSFVGISGISSPLTKSFVSSFISVFFTYPSRDWCSVIYPLLFTQFCVAYDFKSDDVKYPVSFVKYDMSDGISLIYFCSLTHCSVAYPSRDWCSVK